MPNVSRIILPNNEGYDLADNTARALVNRAIAFDYDGSSKNKFKIPTRIGTSNNNAAQSFTQGGVKFTCNLDGTITVERVSSSTYSVQVWLYDDSAAILIDDWCDGNYYFSPGFVGSATTARIRLAKLGGGGEHMTVEGDVLIPDRGSYTSINTSIMVYTGFTGTMTVKPMVCHKDIYAQSPAYVPQHPSVSEIWQAVLALNATRGVVSEINMDLREGSER